MADRYLIERELGAGGMATVYLAHDLKHDRKVALKVLRPELAAVIGAERFLAEIKTTANLQHPHILPLFDSGAVDGTVFYAMPFVAGESLRDRLTREKQLPIPDAIRIAAEVAGALDYAHRHGVIHRDIKPENILLHDGRAVVADFGIALAAATTGGARMTETGMSLGTPHYMSPEQAMGERTLDARSDIYALGCVLYEMLAGEPPFTGPTAQAIVAKVMTADPVSLIALRKTVPAHVDAVTMTALAKLPADRFATARELAEALASESWPGRLARPARTAPARGSTLIPWVVAAAATLVAAFLGLRRTRPESLPAVAFTIDALPGEPIGFGGVAVSPDGRQIIYTVQTDSTVRLMSRVVDDFEPRPMTGPVRPTPALIELEALFFSPDGSRIGFADGGRLMAASPNGTKPPTPIPGAPRLTGIFTGATWTPDGTLIVAAEMARGLIAIAPDGTTRPLVEPDRNQGEIGLGFPEVLPDGKTLLYAVLSRSGWSLAARRLPSGKPVLLIAGATASKFLAPNQLVYSKAGGLYRVRFDPRSLAVEGEAEAIAVGLPNEFFAAGHHVSFAVSRTGTLVFAAGDQRNQFGSLLLVDRAGHRTPLRDGHGERPRFHPTRPLIAAGDSGQIWLYDLARGGTRTRLTSGSVKFVPAWTPDGERIIVSSFESGPAELVSIAANGAGDSRPLLGGPFRQYAGSWTPDGRAMAFVRVTPDSTGLDIWIRTSEGQVAPLMQTPYDESHPRFSPDGRRLAYTSNGSGRTEVYLRGYPEAGETIRVSADGGTQPVWAPSGRELFYLAGGKIMVVSVAGGLVGSPKLLLDLPGLLGDDISWPYDISPDGSTFVVSLASPAPPVHLRVITDIRGKLPSR